MSKKSGKTNRRPRERAQARSRRGLWGGLLHFFVSKWGLGLILAAAATGVVLWQWQAISSWVNDVVSDTLGLFGWGLILIGIVVLVILGAIFRKHLAAFALRFKLNLWNIWLGIASFMAAVWGILALFNLGGSIGQAIVSSNLAAGILRVIGLVVLGFILVAPRTSLHLLVRLVSWVLQKSRRLPRRPRPVEALPQSLDMAAQADSRTLDAPVAARTRQKATEPVGMALEPEAGAAPVMTPALAPAQRDLRQVAEEVWKKYGESPSLVTIDGWRLPPIDILDRVPEVEYGEADNLERARHIEEALASYGVSAKVVEINAGPTVTQFGLEPGWDLKTKEVREKDKDGVVRVKQEEVSKTRVKVERITSLANDLALALAAPSIRIEAPIPGKSVVGVEVPNTIAGMVSLRGVIETTPFQKLTTKSKLALAMGKGAGGEAIAADLARMPHLLIAGATGSGKTVCLNTIICCLLMRNTPFDVRFIMVDPKRVELTPFNSIPHLATPVIVDANKALTTLRWLNQEMDNRYKKLAAAGARNIEGYNKNKQGEDRMPYLVLIIDELADLMMTGFDEVEHILCRLAQLARATGIHLVVATQRPSVDVVTGLIKANFPTRISFAVTSQVDSRTILDMAGAEKLLGKGDMLFMPTEAAKPKRLQGCFVSDPETERLVYFWSRQQKEEAATLSAEELVPPAAAARKGDYPGDPLLDAARALAKEHKQISTSYLQRKLRIGYPRAARLMEELEEETGGEASQPGEPRGDTTP